MNFENIILIEGSQAQKPIYYMVYLYEMSKRGNSIVTDSRSVDGCVVGEVRVTTNGYRVSLVECSKIECGDGFTTL